MTDLANAEELAEGCDAIGLPRVAVILRGLAKEVLASRDAESLRQGFDRRGPDVGVDWSGRTGFPCTCYWSSRHHGDVCPEHGRPGLHIG